MIKIDHFPKIIAIRLLEELVPEHSTVGARLLESIEHETIVTDSSAINEFKLEMITVDQMLENNKTKIKRKTNFNVFFTYMKNNEELSLFLKNEIVYVCVPISDKIKGYFSAANPQSSVHLSSQGFSLFCGYG